MAHDRLFPKTGQPFLPPAEAIDRLRAVFPNVQIDRQRGVDHVRRMVEQLRRMRDLTPPPATDEQITQLERRQGESVFVLIADSTPPGLAGLTTCIIPGEPLFFGYSSASHQEAARPVLVRCAAALGYEIEGG